MRSLASAPDTAGNHARPVLHHQANVVGAWCLSIGEIFLSASRSAGTTKAGISAAARHVDQVGDDGPGGRPLPRAAALEHGRADEVALDHDGVEHAFDVRDRRGQRHHAGMHALLDAVTRLARQAQELYAEAQLLGELDVHGADVADAFDMHAGEVDLGAERGARQHGELVRGIDAVDVEAGVGLGA